MLMLGHRLRRWSNINPALASCIAFTGMCLFCCRLTSEQHGMVLAHAGGYHFVLPAGPARRDDVCVPLSPPVRESASKLKQHAGHCGE